MNITVYYSAIQTSTKWWTLFTQCQYDINLNTKYILDFDTGPLNKTRLDKNAGATLQHFFISVYTGAYYYTVAINQLPQSNCNTQWII